MHYTSIITNTKWLIRRSNFSLIVREINYYDWYYHLCWNNKIDLLLFVQAKFFVVDLTIRSPYYRIGEIRIDTGNIDEEKFRLLSSMQICGGLGWFSGTVVQRYVTKQQPTRNSILWLRRRLLMLYLGIIYTRPQHSWLFHSPIRWAMIALQIVVRINEGGV